MLKRTSFLAVVLMGVLAAGCGSGGLGASGNSVSLDQEWQLGNQMAAQVAQQMQLSNDATAKAYLTSVGERIHATTPLADRPFTFDIVNDPNVNAFSIPGGHIYINAGLIAQADKADELAGVVAHEISHVVARHVIKQVETQQEIGAIGAILLGQNPNGLQQLLAQVIAGGAMARFSRADEKEADDLGLQFMTKAGYDPHGMLDMFQKLLSLEKGGNSSVTRFFADHPGTQDRINDISGRIAKMGNPTGIVDDPAYHSNLKDRVAR
ncbi:MAG: M48 family metalloprotease [Acidobacteria bacterium]|nr:M48 family metalloprotease [Acidobacteriota bacterium]MBV9071896.1 M48 family metalloprotease [Acidobacteriota bacterium]MBV9188297.1 M48 family metalloprotease [Acidobacteriota bacterium]